MSNVLKVEFKETYLTQNNINNLLRRYEVELKSNNFKSIFENETKGNRRAYDRVDDSFFTLIEFMSNENIPSSFTSISTGAFIFCNNLIKITIPEGVTSIGSDAFYECKELEDVILPNTLTSICYSAFGRCNKLRSITIPESVTSIHSFAFYNCFNVTIKTKNPYVIDYCKEHNIK